MMFKKKLVINPQKYLVGFNAGNSVRIGIRITEETKPLALDIGFSSDFRVGENILPDIHISRATYENSEGKCVVRRDLPKEEYERSWTRHWTDWGGHDHYDTAYYTAQRYVRERFTPKLFELVVVTSEKHGKWIVCDKLNVSEANNDDFKLIMNIFLNIFGQFEVVNDNFESPVFINKTYDWEILKSGKIAEKDIDKALGVAVERHSSNGQKEIHKSNVETLKKAKPDIVGIGMKGFSGYLIFYYPAKKIAILENLLPNNATYVLNENWEKLSKMSKTEILNNRLQIDRIFHYSTWNERIGKYV